MEVGLLICRKMKAVVAFTLFLSISGIHSISFTFINNCPFTLWPATLTAPNSPPLPTTGLELPAGATSSIDGVLPSWSGRIWARTQCCNDPTGKFTCITGDCSSGQVPCAGAGGTPPTTLIEMTLTASDGLDYYDISLVDGFNLPVLVVPQGGGGGCPTTTCGVDVNAGCPKELAVVGPDWGVVACKSACLAFGTEEYCCTGSHNTGATCPPTSYSEMFKRKCPQAYSYAYDDKSSTFTCPTGGNYLFKFCP